MKSEWSLALVKRLNEGTNRMSDIRTSRTSNKTQSSVRGLHPISKQQGARSSRRAKRQPTRLKEARVGQAMNESPQVHKGTIALRKSQSWWWLIVAFKIPLSYSLEKNFARLSINVQWFRTNSCPSALWKSWSKWNVKCSMTVISLTLMKTAGVRGGSSSWNTSKSSFTSMSPRQERVPERAKFLITSFQHSEIPGGQQHWTNLSLRWTANNSSQLPLRPLAGITCGQKKRMIPPTHPILNIIPQTAWPLDLRKASFSQLQ